MLASREIYLAKQFFTPPFSAPGGNCQPLPAPISYATESESFREYNKNYN